MKIYSQVLTFSIKRKTWLFHVVVLLTTATKWTKVKIARAGRTKLLFLPTKYANFVTFSMPSPLSLLKLHIMCTNACRMCSTIIFPISTNNLIVLWCCRFRSQRRFLNSLVMQFNQSNREIFFLFTRAWVGHRPRSVQRRILRLHEPGSVPFSLG